jgi:pyruvate ferredoxin oxidoreductase delta subunit
MKTCIPLALHLSRMSMGQNREISEYSPYSLPTVGSAGKTGHWRSIRPVILPSKCNKCDLCWLYCPEGTISKCHGYVPVVDLEYCKGCGICAAECPSQAIEMKKEEEEAE